MVDSVNTSILKNLVEAYERAHSEKNKNTSQTAVGKVWKKIKSDFPEAHELEEVVRRHANEWKTLSFTKKSKVIDVWSKAVQKIKSKVTNESLLTISQEITESVTTNDKSNPQPSIETPVCTTNTAAPTPAQEEVKQKINKVTARRLHQERQR